MEMILAPHSGRPLGLLSINPMQLLGAACALLALVAAGLLVLPWANAQHPERTALFLAVVAVVQLGYMLLKPPLPWLVVTAWAVFQWHVLFMAFERTSGPAMWLVLVAMVIQSGIALQLGLQSCGHLLSVRRFNKE